MFSCFLYLERLKAIRQATVLADLAGEARTLLTQPVPTCDLRNGYQHTNTGICRQTGRSE